MSCTGLPIRLQKISQGERTTVNIRWPLKNPVGFYSTFLRVLGLDKGCAWRLKASGDENWTTDYSSRLKDCCSRQKIGAFWLNIDKKSADILPQSYFWRKTASTAILPLVHMPSMRLSITELLARGQHLLKKSYLVCPVTNTVSAYHNRPLAIIIE